MAKPAKPGPATAAVEDETGWVEATLRARPEKFARILEQAAELRAQVIVGKLERVKASKGHPAHWKLFQDGFRTDAEYFYPASAIKICVAVTALAEFRQVTKKVSGVARDTPLAWYSIFSGPKRIDKDATSPDGNITLDWELHKALILSDNDAYNRLFEMSGQREANERLWEAGLPSVRIWHRLNSTRTAEENRHTQRIDILVPGRRNPPSIPERTSELELAPPNIPGLDVGTAYIATDNKTRVEGPMSFREKNAVSLVDLQRLLAAIVRPDVETGVHDLGLQELDRRFLRDVLGEDVAKLNPTLWNGPDYLENDFRPSLPGVLRVKNRTREDIDTRGKAGRAYGFHVENAYYRDKKTGRAFFLAAVLYANKNGVLNDGLYEYDSMTEPFMQDLGEVFAQAVFESKPAKPARRAKPSTK